MLALSLILSQPARQRFVDRMIDKGAVAVVEIRNQDGDQPGLRSEIMIGEADRDVRPARYVGDLEIAVAVINSLMAAATMRSRAPPSPFSLPRAGTLRASRVATRLLN